MREVSVAALGRPTEGKTLAACLATILEVDLTDVPEPPPGEELPGWRLTRWLGGLGLGVVPIGDAEDFTWAGPWIGIVRPAADEERLAVVMYGVPSGVAWDPWGAAEAKDWRLEGGFVVAALDVALARPSLPQSPASVGTVEGIFTAPSAGEPAQSRDRLERLSGRIGPLPGDAPMRAVPGGRSLRVASRSARARTPRRPARRHPRGRCHARRRRGPPERRVTTRPIATLSFTTAAGGRGRHKLDNMRAREFFRKLR